MADDGSKQGTPWPMPQFRFEVDLAADLKNIVFQEISGMDVESQIIEYRKTNSPVFSPIKMPGIAKYGNVTMKRGMFVNDDSFWNWYKEISINTIKRKTVFIKLLDESGSVIVQWQLNNAWPTKITSTDLKSDGKEVAIDTLEIAHEGITVTNNK